MNLPTVLTFLRIPLTVVIIALLSTPGWIAKAAALGCFLLAGVTDWLDGRLARRWNQCSAFGALLDPVADKVLILGVFLGLLWLELMPAWMVGVVVFREVLVTGIRLAAARRGVVISAAKEGKHKLASQVLAIVVILSVLVLREWAWPAPLSAPTELWLGRLITACLWLTVTLTLISGVSFCWRQRALLRSAL